MPHDVKLDCYILKIRNRKNRNGRTEYFPLTDLNFVDEGQREQMDFNEIFRRFIAHFDGAFAGISGNETVIYPPPGEVTFASERRLIHGYMKAGKSGVGRQIVDRNNPEEEVFVVTPEHVDSIEYFFLLWVPNEGNRGFMMVQGLSTDSISDTFVRLVKKYFSDRIEDRYIEIDKFVPKETIDRMKENGNINKITLRKNHLSSDRANQILGVNFIDTPVVIEVRVTGISGYSNEIKALIDGRFGDAFRNLMDGEPRFFTTPLLEQVGMDGSHDVLVEYEFNGKKATAKQSQAFQLNPFYYVDEDSIIRDPMTNLPTKESLRQYCLEFFDHIMANYLTPNRQNVQD